MGRKKPAWKNDPFDTFRYEKRKAWFEGIEGIILDSCFRSLLFYAPKTADRPVCRVWMDFDDPRLTIHQPGRPRKHNSQAEKQRAYRERKAGKALRNYQKR